MKTILLIALLQLGPEWPGGHGHKTAPIAKPAPPAEPGPPPARSGEESGWKMQGGCKHLLSRAPVDVAVEDTPDGAVLHFRGRDPRVAQQVARQASACLGGKGEEQDDQGEEDQKRGKKEKHRGHDEGED